MDEDNLANLVNMATISARSLWRSGNPSEAESLRRTNLNAAQTLNAALRLGADHPPPWSPVASSRNP
jgi:hypothetical protein